MSGNADERQSAVKPLLVNPYEAAADRLLRETVDAHGDRLMLKARLADVIDVDNMHGLTSRAKYYSLSAHLDFVVIDKDTSRGRFAVELDGRQHVTDSKTIDRDKLKDELCSRADLPLLRIASDFARKIGRWRVLTYLTEAFYRCESWLQSQVSGYIPMDEPFFMGSAITPDEKGRLTFDALDSGVILDFHEHYESGKLPCRLPDVWVTDLPEIRAVQAHAWITVAPNRYLLAKTVVRRFRFRGISSGELAEQLAVVEIGDLAQRWIRNEAVAVEGRTIAKAVAEVQQSIDAGGLISCIAGDTLRIGGAIGPRFGSGTPFRWTDGH